MELLNDFNPADPISLVLRVVRIRSTVWCRSLLGVPWGFGVQAHANPAFHVVTSGRCWLEVDGESGQRALGAGDLVVLRDRRRHWMRDDPATPAPELEEILASTPLDEHRRLRHGGHGARTGLLCGGFALEGGTAPPILSALPAAVHIRGAAGLPVPWLAATLALITAETASDAPGAEEVVGRLADVLLTQALRVALTELPSPPAEPVSSRCATRRSPPRSSTSTASPSAPGRSATSRPRSRSPARRSRRVSGSLWANHPGATSPAPAWRTPQRCCTRPTHRSRRSPRKPATRPSSPSAKPSSALSASRRAPTADRQTRFPGSVPTPPAAAVAP